MADRYCWRCQPARFPMPTAEREYAGIRHPSCRPVPAWAMYHEKRHASFAHPYLNGEDLTAANVVEACAGTDGWVITLVKDAMGANIVCPCGSGMDSQEVRFGNVELIWSTPAPADTPQ